MSSIGWWAASRCYSVKPDDEQSEVLLGRKPHPLSLEFCQTAMRDATVLVTGAGGFIGSELCSTLAALGASVIAADNNEYALTNLAETISNRKVTFELLDIRDLARVKTLFETHRPSLVFHAAAYKHVPFLEHLPVEAIENNVLATGTLAQACCRFGVKQLVFVSSDKAASPLNVLGMSKRLAEILLSSMLVSEVNFTSVRCANVLGSPGSLLPRALDQISRGGPVTLTSPTATRYFMTLQETAHAILYASTLPITGGIFIPDAGTPVLIRDLLTRLIYSQAGQNSNVKVEVVGLRPGDQDHELLVSHQEQAEAITCQSMRIVRVKRPLQPAQTESLVENLASFCHRRDELELRVYIQSVLRDCI